MKNIKNLVQRLLNLPKAIAKIFISSIAFIKESFAELSNVTWLSRRDTLKFSTYILGFIVLGAAVVAFVDLGIFELFKLITQ